MIVFDDNEICELRIYMCGYKYMDCDMSVYVKYDYIYMKMRMYEL